MVCFPCYNVPFTGQGFLLLSFVCLPVYPKQLGRFLARSRHQGNIYRVNDCSGWDWWEHGGCIFCTDAGSAQQLLECSVLGGPACERGWTSSKEETAVPLDLACQTELIFLPSEPVSPTLSVTQVKKSASHLWLSRVTHHRVSQYRSPVDFIILVLIILE